VPPSQAIAQAEAQRAFPATTVVKPFDRMMQHWLSRIRLRGSTNWNRFCASFQWELLAVRNEFSERGWPPVPNEAGQGFR
jgi:hypothetical protein